MFSSAKQGQEPLLHEGELSKTAQNQQNLLDVIYELSERGKLMPIPNSSLAIQLRPHLGTELVLVYDPANGRPRCVLRCIEQSVRLPDLVSKFKERGVIIPYSSTENNLLSRIVHLRCGGPRQMKTNLIEVTTLRGILLALGLTDE